ncbi:MAG: aminoglycoside adenylyltransferase domain-containing protein [Bacillota bacterium]
MYLHGSLATGGFDPDRSDVDFLVVTTGHLSAERLAALERLHRCIAAGELIWRTQYEGSFIPVAALRRHDPSDSVFPAVRVDSSFGLDYHGSDWVIQRHLIREKGICLAGPPATALIDPVSADDLKRAVRGVLQEWWAPQLRDPVRLRRSEYQAYAVLTMCRALYTLELGHVASKPEAARWAKQGLGAQWERLIDAALAWRRGREMDHLKQTLALIEQVLQHDHHGVQAGTRHKDGQEHLVHPL